MIERIEILKDGASSIYGSDAVGGVASFLTRSNFDGFEIVGQGDMREEAATRTIASSAIWGSQGERGGVVAAVEYFNRSPYDWHELSLIKDQSRHDQRPVATRRLAGALHDPEPQRGRRRSPGPATIADPLCDQFPRGLRPPAIRSRGRA